MHDIIIIGGGPAGISAALTAKNRGKSVLVIGNDAKKSDIYKAPHVANYPGLPNISGKDLMEVFTRQLEESEVDIITARALNAMPFGAGFFVSVGNENYECRSIIMSTGLARGKLFEGEAEYLGRGVSYCATCDGMLYRGKKVAVVGQSEYAEEEAEALRGMGCEVEYFDKTRARAYKIKGGEAVEALIADGEEYPVSGIFILRNTISPESFLAGLAIENGHIVVSDSMETSVKGVFAAGDCIGRPYQLARAVGQGNTAALSACEFLDKK